MKASIRSPHSGLYTGRRTRTGIDRGARSRDRAGGVTGSSPDRPGREFIPNQVLEHADQAAEVAAVSLDPLQVFPVVRVKVPWEPAAGEGVHRPPELDDQPGELDRLAAGRDEPRRGGPP
jgi:hypothetical protein